MQTITDSYVFDPMLNAYISSFARQQIDGLEARIKSLEDLILSVRKQGPLGDVINAMIREANRIESLRQS